MGIGDWGLGIGDWGFGPNPQSPILIIALNKIKLFLKLNIQLNIFIKLVFNKSSFN